jgi:uncharacterized repeat protein (TIGR03803 family)
MPKNPSRVTGVRQSLKSVRHASVTETVLYSFGGTHGQNPEAGLTYFKGTLYGTTLRGGDYKCPHAGVGGTCGTVFTITPSGAETVLHSFKGGKDGSHPAADLIMLSGTLYGTTTEGGGCTQFPEGCGTVFSITPSGHEIILHAFAGSTDGWSPEAPLHNVDGTMYGTTNGGGLGTHGAKGTAFTITPSGIEQLIYTFHLPQGAPPGVGALVDLNGTLYGTASGGGKYGQGTVFSLSTSGREKLLHSFNDQGNKDGADPGGGLIAIKHTLYGTTFAGGTLYCGGSGFGCGTVFSITPSGSETVLHRFTGSDGDNPYATLLNVNGTLYGTTIRGGAHDGGTVFSISPSGAETVLHSFMGGKDGANPQSDLIYVNGKLYGTTESGGVHFSGTVFSITL